MHNIISKYTQETSIVSALFSFCGFCVKLFLDKLMQLLDNLFLR